MSLTAGEMESALARIGTWRADAEADLSCPRCGRAGLQVADRSARPYAEWYHLACAGCGLDETIHIPMGPPVMGGQE